MAENAPEHQDRGLFGLFGKKDEHQQAPHGNAEHHGNAPVPVAPAYHHESGVTLEPVHSAEYGHVVDPPKHGHGHGHEGGGGITSKLHRSDSSSSSSSDEEGEHGKKKKDKKGLKDKLKEKLPAGHKDEQQHHKIEEQHHHVEEGEKKQGFMDKIKEKLPGHKKEGEH